MSNSLNYGDRFARYYKDYFIFKRVKYGIGTRAKFVSYGITAMATFIGGDYPKWKSDNALIIIGEFQSPIEIIEPVYYKDDKVVVHKETIKEIITHKPHPNNVDEVFYAWWWYIAAMLIGSIFKMRLIIWIIATIRFFGWKSTK